MGKFLGAQELILIRTFRRRLRWILARTDDFEFFRAIWVLVNSDRPEFSCPDGYDFPKCLLVGSPRNEPKIFSWEIETLSIEMLSTPKSKHGTNKNPRNWSYFAVLINLIRRIDDLESVRLNGGSIFARLANIAHRQFLWQSAPINEQDLIMWHTIFSSPDLRDLFVERCGISPDLFMSISSSLSIYFQENSIVSEFLFNTGGREGEADISSNLLRLLSQELVRSSEETTISDSAIYRQSPFRERPVLHFRRGERSFYICPIPLLLFWRATRGMYYDVIQDIRAPNYIGKAFEGYVKLLLSEVCGEDKVISERRYQIKKGVNLATPDVMTLNGAILDLVIECKSTKIPLSGKILPTIGPEFSRAIEEIAKGVFQIIRFIDHVTSGIIEGLSIDHNTIFIVLTLDDWGFSLGAVERDIYDRSMKYILKRNISENFDVRRVVIMTAQELNVLYSSRSDGEIRELLRLRGAEKYEGYHLLGLANELFGYPKCRRKFPLSGELSEIFKGIEGA